MRLCECWVVCLCDLFVFMLLYVYVRYCGFVGWYVVEFLFCENVGKMGICMISVCEVNV